MTFFSRAIRISYTNVSLCECVYMFVCACVSGSVILCEGSPVPLSTHLSLRLTVYPLFSLSLRLTVYPLFSLSLRLTVYPLFSLSLRLTVYPLFSLSLLSPLIVVDETILRFPLQNLLELEELNTPSPSSSSSSSPSPADAMVRLDGVALSWSADGDKKVISGVSFTVDEVSPSSHPVLVEGIRESGHLLSYCLFSLGTSSAGNSRPCWGWKGTCT